MNCKPGDLAVVVKSSGYGVAGEISKLLVGRIVRVTKLDKPVAAGLHCSADLVWSFEEPVKLEFDGKSYTAHGIADDCLRPIRDPGDDARDESLSWLPVSSREEVSA